MANFEFRLNPAFDQLKSCSAVLNGVARSYQVEHYRTTLSLKSVTRGAALYETREGRHLVTEDSFLILNHEQEYSLEFQGTVPTETVCPFFQPHFFEHVADSLGKPMERQLDEIEVRASTTDFCERLYPKTGTAAQILAQLRMGLRSPRKCTSWLEDCFYALAAALAEIRGGVQREIEHFPGQRPATRQELYRRLHRGRDFLSSCYEQPLTVALAAKAAHFSARGSGRLAPNRFHPRSRIGAHSLGPQTCKTLD